MKVGDQVIARIARCQCVGGGTTEIEGQIIGFVADNVGGWWQISTSSGVHYVREKDIVR
jgi:hypothetical protein